MIEVPYGNIFVSSFSNDNIWWNLLLHYWPSEQTTLDKVVDLTATWCSEWDIQKSVLRVSTCHEDVTTWKRPPPKLRILIPLKTSHLFRYLMFPGVVILNNLSNEQSRFRWFEAEWQDKQRSFHVHIGRAIQSPISSLLVKFSYPTPSHGCMYAICLPYVSSFLK